MSKTLRIYLAGKVSSNSSFGTEHWRERVCEELSKETGYTIINLDPTRGGPDFSLEENNPAFIFGRDCFLIRSADVVIVYLSDDISVGGSQEMLIAKYFQKPLIGIAHMGGKFRCDKTIGEKLYPRWIHPFVAIPCDEVVEDIREAAHQLRRYTLERLTVKNLQILEESMHYYETNFYAHDAQAH